MSNVKGRPTEPIARHRILREAYRHYPEYRDYVMAHGGTGVIEHGYWVYPVEAVLDSDGEPLIADGEAVVKELPRYKVSLAISFWDLHNALHTLSDRKREAMFYNVILDWKQRDVAKKMGITTVSVGQYVEQACLQLAERYFAEMEDV